jgi:hypothetical protein
MVMKHLHRAPSGGRLVVRSLEDAQFSYIRQQVCIQVRGFLGMARAKKNQSAEQPIPTPKSRRLALVPGPRGPDYDIAKAAASPHVSAALVAVDYARPTHGDVSLMETIAVLSEKSEAVNAGNLKDAEALLMSQAFALNSIFGELARRAALNMGEYLDAADKYMRLALKAQGQCRATLETLATIKNPPVLFAKQANIAHGPQQVNNGTPLPARTENATIAPNELLEAHTVTGLDCKATAAAARSDSALATVGALHGAANG